MAITDNKILSADLVGKKVADQADDFDTDADVTKGWFDSYPDVIVTKVNALIDSLIVNPLYFESTVAAATANKGTFDGWLPTGAIIDLVMSNGNTAASPTITIDGATYNITGMPTVAQVQANSTQAYKLKKTAGTTLAFVSLPDYVCERGVDANGWQYERKASGKAECHIRHNVGTVAVSSLYATINAPITLYAGLTGIGHNFPFTFVAVEYSLTAHESNDDGYAITANYNTGVNTTTPPPISICRIQGTTASLTNVILSNRTIGTWR